MRIYAALITAVLVAGCANWSDFSSEQNRKYSGKPVDAMLGEWGTPIGAVELTDGGWFYEFQYFRGGYECHAKAWTNAQKIVSNVKVSGQNGCIM